MSDWGAQHTTEASALTGLDMAMPGDGPRNAYGSYWGGALTEAVLAGTIPRWRLDDMAVRIMAAYFKVHVGNHTDRPDINFSAWTNQSVGYLHPSSREGETVVNKRVDVQADHAALIREIGAKSIVLLKNVNRTLPLVKPNSIAVIGEDAQDNPGGPNACADRGCNRGTLAMGYGSGTAEFPYLVSPAAALEARARADNTAFINIKSNWDLDAAKAAAASASVAIVFANADAGEGYMTVGGNAGDRANLTLWNGGDELIRAVASANPNTVVVLHTPGPVVVDYAKAHPNVTAILWAGLPGQESGNALADVLYGAVNPQGRTPFTWDRSAAEYGAEVMYTSPTPAAPVQEFSEGLFIDYRYFMREGIEPVFEFGFGLSYTRFMYSNLSIEVHDVPSYVPTGGTTVPAPTYGETDMAREANVVPEGFQKISPYVYPWVTLKASAAAGTGVAAPAGSLNGSAQPVLPAGGAPGGNPRLYDVVYSVSFVVENIGDVAGTDIPQLYLQLGPDDPWGVLRGFDEVPLQPGEAKTVTLNLTRRDVSMWNTTLQDWVITDYEKFVFVGYSSISIGLNATLPALAA